MQGTLQMIAEAHIPGLLSSGLAETGCAQVLAGSAAAPARFEQDGARVVARVRVAPPGARDEVRGYVLTASREMRCDVQVHQDGSVWMSSSFALDGRWTDLLTTSIRLTRMVIDAANWLQADDTARAVWSSLAGVANTPERR